MCGVAAAVAILILEAACSDGVDRREDPVKLIFGGRNLSVPNAYFEPLFFPDLKVEPESLFMRVYWPGFTAAPTRPVAANRRGGHEDRILISLGKAPASLQPAYAAIASERLESTPFHDAYGLRAFYAEPSRMHDAIRREVYFMHERQAVTILIICEPGHRSPPCEHRFNALGLSFKLTYSMDHIADWLMIQDGVTLVTKSFIEHTR